MSENKWTPGPWGRRPGCDDYKVVNADGWRIADCHDASPRINGLANAQLIAAALEMYEALEEALGVLTEPGMMDVDEWKAWQKRAIQDISAALSKARGGK